MTGERKPLTHAERGKLGGLRAKMTNTPEQRRQWGSKGGSTTVERHGAYHMTRLAYIRHGRLAPDSDSKGGA